MSEIVLLTYCLYVQRSGNIFVLFVFVFCVFADQENLVCDDKKLNMCKVDVSFQQTQEATLTFHLQL